MMRFAEIFGLLAAPAVKALQQECNCCISTLHGILDVVTSDDPDFDDARAQFASQMSSKDVSNGMLSPSAIIFAKSEGDVLYSVEWASKCSYSISMRTGGHNYGGLSSCSDTTKKCLQLDVSNLNASVVHQDGTVTLGVGLKLWDVYGLMASLGYIIPGGICKTVRLGGHLQSSAVGFFARPFGLGMDYVKTINMVTADANVVAVTYESDPDLYWSILGGSPGSWGAVVNYTVAPIRSSDYPMVTSIFYAWPWISSKFVQFADAFVKLNQVSETARDFTCFIDIGPRDHPTPTIPVMSLECIWVGVDSGPLTDDLFEKYFQQFLDLQADVPMLNVSFKRDMPINDAQMAYVDLFDWGEYRYQIHGAATPKWLNSSFWQTLASELDYRNSIGLHTYFQIFGLGGTGQQSQYNRNRGKTAYAQRNAMLSFDDWIFYENNSQATVAEERVQIFREENAMYWEVEGVPDSSWMTPNTIDDNQHISRFENYFPNMSWFHKLRSVKTRIDKHNLFYSLMTIPPYRLEQYEV